MRDSDRQLRYGNGEIVPRVTVDEKSYTIVSKLAAESVGTAFFVFIGVLSALGSAEWNSTANAAFAHGFAIAVNVAAFGHISGGHFNPAVSLSVFLSGRMKPLHFGAYVAAQLFGAFVGASLVRLVTSYDEYDSFLGGATILPDSAHWLRAFAAEVVLTTLLTTVVLALGVDVKNNTMAPFAIGLTVAAGVFSIKSLSGACMNPARSFSPVLAASLFIQAAEVRAALWHHHYIYWAGPALGATISAFFYRIVFARGYNRLLP